MKNTPTLRVSMVAVMTAVTFVLTVLPRVPIPFTNGYIHLGDAAIYFTAVTFGPLTAMICGGLGTALADLVGYPQWTLISLVAHGLQGLLIGLLVRGAGRLGWIPAFVAGTAVMCAVYFVGGSLLRGPGNALLEVPWNVVQNAAGVLVGFPLSLAVKRAYPPVRELGW